MEKAIAERLGYLQRYKVLFVIDRFAAVVCILNQFRFVTISHVLDLAR